jgi:hypothetical protein
MTRGGSGATSGALRGATTRWQRRGRGKVARRSRRQRDNRGDATASWQTRGKREGRHTRQTGGEASADKRRRSTERTRGSGGLRRNVRRRDNQPEAPASAKSARPPSLSSTPSRVGQRRRRCKPAAAAVIGAVAGATKG